MALFQKKKKKKAACGHALKSIPTENDILSTPCLTLLVLFKEKQNVEEIANGMSSSKFIILNNIFMFNMGS